MQELIKKIKNQFPISTEAEKYLFSIAKEKKVAKGDILIREGQAVNKIYYVKNGCLRSYCIDQSGKEHTLLFAIKDWWMSDYIAIHTNEPASLMVDCLIDTTVLEFDSKKLSNSLNLFPEFEPFQRYTLERHVVSLQKRILNQLQLTAKERYDLFLEQYPDTEQYARNYHIASYLGITQQSLSRIRVEKAN